MENTESYNYHLSSLGEAGLESPGSTCPGAEASQVDLIKLNSVARGKNIDKVLFMWSLDAGEFRMPPNVSLAVGGASTVQHLVLQVCRQIFHLVSQKSNVATYNDLI